MSGSDVRALQVDLTKAGFKTPAVGVFGPQTKQNVEAFQSKFHMTANGVVTPSVVQELGMVLAGDETDATSGSGGSGLSSGTTGTSSATSATGKSSTKSAGKKAKTSPVQNTADPTTALSSDPVLAPVTQDGGSAHLGERTLKEGMSGHDVKVMQDYLTIAGYPTSIDGEFGSATETSVMSFEQANNLTADGTMTYADSRVLRQDVANALAGGAVSNATLNADGTVTAPAGAPQLVQEVIAAANQIINTPYVYGGGHGSWNSNGYDCSGAVSFALHGANLLNSPEDSTELESYGAPGPGKWITIYADAQHTFIVVAGLAFDTAHYGPTTPGGTGPRWLQPADKLANLSDGGNYIVRHPDGL